MRVYGTSPLYSYVELVFRSKRLFIFSILAATVVTAAVAAFRSGEYTATAVILLSGNAEATPGIADDTARGSIHYKLNVLNIVARDPVFLKEAMDEKGLTQGMTADQLQQFLRRVRNSLGFNSSENVLEISCHWPTAQAADIVDGFYDLYSRRVLDEETAMSARKTVLLQELLGDYTQRVQEVEKRVIGYEQAHTGNALTDWDQANVNLDNQMVAVQDMQNQIDTANMRMQELQRRTAATPRTITADQERQSPTQSPEYQQLVAMRDKRMADLADLRRKYQEAHPDIMKAKDDIARLQQQIAALTRTSAAKGKIGPVTRVREEINPDYQDLQRQWTNAQIDMASLKKQFDEARKRLADLTVKARVSPNEQYQYKWLQVNKGMYEGMRANLAAKLEEAKVDEKVDRELHTAEMHMEVQPEAEPETASARNLMLYSAGPLLGLIIAFAFSLLAESLDHSLRTPMEIERFLGKPVLAVLPKLDAKRARGQIGPERQRPGLPTA